MELFELQEVIEKLAKGMNYYTGEVAGDGEIINDVKISRALIEVNDILKGLLFAPQKKNTSKSGKMKFVYDENIIKTVRIESRAISLSQIARNVVSAYNGECKLSYYDLTPLLHEKGILIENPDEESPKLIASDLASQYGITVYRHRTRRGERWQTAYDENGQKFVLDILKELQ